MSHQVNKASKEYWDNKIVTWEKSYFDNGSQEKISLLEIIASKFRKPLIARKENLIKIIDSYLSDSTICEFGCGSGDLLLKLSGMGIKKGIGLDVSPRVIDLANKVNTSKKISFDVSDLSSSDNIPKADIYFGLGFIDYLTIEEIKELINNINKKGGKYVFSVPEDKINLLNIIHLFYLKMAGCPKFFKFKKKDFESIIDHKFITLNNQLFITNLK